jgi:hypothetical protein
MREETLMSKKNRARAVPRRRTAAVVVAAAASGGLIAMGAAAPATPDDGSDGSSVLAQNQPPPPQPPPPPGQAPPLEEQPPGGGQDEQDGLQEGEGGQKLGGIDAGMSVESVNVVNQDLDDSEPEQVEYRFAQPVVDVGSPDSFQLSGFNTNASAKAESATIVSGDTSAILAEYAPGTDVEAFTVAVTDSGAVQNESGRTNPPNTSELQGGEAQVEGSDTPRLEGVRENPTLDRVTYTFDRNLNESKGGSADASKLGLYTLDGRAINGQSIVTTNDDTVTVQFDSQVGDGVRYFAESGAVTDTRGVENSPSATGEDTTAPSLTSTSDLIGQTQFEYTFDQPVTANDAKSFVAYTADGKGFEGSSVVQPNPETIRVAYPEIQEFGDQISLAAVNADAVKSSDGSATPNVVGDQSISSDTAGRLTSGPDLEGATLNSDTGQVQLNFDEPIDENKTYDSAGFQLITAAGDRVDARSFVEVDGNSVLVNFNRAAAEAAESVTVANDAVQDNQGNGNLLSNTPLGGGAGDQGDQLNPEGVVEETPPGQEDNQQGDLNQDDQNGNLNQDDQNGDLNQDDQNGDLNQDDQNGDQNQDDQNGDLNQDDQNNQNGNLHQNNQQDDQN